MAELGRTGQTESTELGVATPSFAEVPWEPEGPGDWVVGYRTVQIEVPFTLECAGTERGSAVFTTTEGTDKVTTLVECGVEPFGDDPYATELLEYCPS